jgi:ADP-heptose:LPS heptosyltransferase
VESALASLPPGGRVAVIRLRSLGDCVLTTPALELLKRYRPDVQIAVVVEDPFRAIFEGNPDVSAILRPELRDLRRFRADLAVNFHGGTRSASMTALSGARLRAGFGHYRNQFVYNVRIPRAQEILGVSRKVHTAEHLASAMFYLGVPVGEIPGSKLVARRMNPARGMNAALHAVASAPDKTWAAEKFLAVARHLRVGGCEPVFIGAASDDLSAFREFGVAQGTLADTKDLLASASLFVGNDSGPAHMAAALGLPVVVFFGPSDREVWAPWRTPSEVLPISASADDAIAAVARLKVAA